MDAWTYKALKALVSSAEGRGWFMISSRATGYIRVVAPTKPGAYAPVSGHDFVSRD